MLYLLTTLFDPAIQLIHLYSYTGAFFVRKECTLPPEGLCSNSFNGFPGIRLSKEADKKLGSMRIASVSFDGC